MTFLQACHVGKSFGLPDVSVREAKERVRTAIKNSGIEFQSRKIVVNLSPADIRKEGTIFDLPIAVGILQNFGEIKRIKEKEIVFVGELSLDGKINSGNSDALDVDRDWKTIDGVKEGLKQYYDIESETDLYSLNSGRVMAKIGVNDRTDEPEKTICSFIIIDRKPHLNENGVAFFKENKWLSFKDVNEYLYD